MKLKTLLFSVLALSLVLPVYANNSCELQRETGKETTDYWITIEELEKEKKLDLAIVCLKELKEIIPENENVSFKLGMNYKKIGSFKESLFYYSIAKDLTKDEGKQLYMYKEIEDLEKKIGEEEQKELQAKQKEIDKKLEEKKNEEEKASAVVEKKMTKEETEAFLYLAEKAKILDGIYELSLTKPKDIQDKFKVLIGKFKESKDEYTKNIGLYIGYLLR